MSIKIDPSGRRSVQSETIVPGTPEQVWQAIATGPGVSSWFVPCEIDERVGGEIKATFGPGMESKNTITSWNPPQSFTASGSEIGPGAPAMATEWIVEAQSGGTCLVRVVHSWFADTDEWDGQFESTELGWGAFFRDLHLYLAHFIGQPSKTFQLMAFSNQPQEQTWAGLASALGIEGKSIGSAATSSEGSPSISGEVKHIGSEDHPEALLLLNEPGPGIGHFFAMPMGPKTALSIRVFIFGSDAAEIASQQEMVWNSWISEHYPSTAQA